MVIANAIEWRAPNQTPHKNPFALRLIDPPVLPPIKPWDRPPTRTISDLTDDERKVIKERANGWESASPGLLALVFSVPLQAINAVLKGEK